MAATDGPEHYLIHRGLGGQYYIQKPVQPQSKHCTEFAALPGGEKGMLQQFSSWMLLNQYWYLG